MTRLSKQQALLLALLPSAPNDGKFCKGPKHRVARRLEEMGLARCTGAGLWGGATFVRTLSGAAISKARGEG